MATKTKKRQTKNPAPAHPAAVPGPGKDAPASVGGVDELTAMMLGSGTLADAPKKASKSSLPVIRLDSILVPQKDKDKKDIPGSSIQDRFIKANADKKDAEAVIKDLGALIKGPAIEALVNHCRSARSYNVSAKLNGRLVFILGRYEPVGPTEEVPFVKQVESLSKLFGDAFARYFDTERVLQIRQDILSNPVRAKEVVSQLKEAVGDENFANWFSFEPSLAMRREGEEQVLQREATMDAEVKAKAEAACAMGLVKKYESVVRP